VLDYITSLLIPYISQKTIYTRKLNYMKLN
jgi:hypothetical protein